MKKGTKERRRLARKYDRVKGRSRAEGFEERREMKNKMN